MEETIIGFSRHFARLPLPPPLPKIPTVSSHNAPPLLRTPTPLLKTPQIPILPSTSAADPTSHFREKILFLDSVGLDPSSLLSSHPLILSVSLSDLRSTVHFLLSMDFTSLDLRRIFSMVPEALTCKPSDLTPVFTFLLREAGVSGSDLRHVIHRRPRLLVSDVATRLRPTLRFLRSLGIAEPSRHCYLLSCSVEGKLIARIEFLENSGFSPGESRAMVRRFPALFCYSIERNLGPKVRFLKEEMERELGELREFPQFFSFSLEKRIRPRVRVCREKGVFFSLPALLRPNDEDFRARLEVCVGSSPPLRKSPLWYRGLDADSL